MPAARDDTTMTTPSRARQIGRVIGGVLAMVLLAGALATVLGRRDVVLDAIDAVGVSGGHAALLVTALLALVVLGVALTGAFFRLLLGRFGRFGRMGLVEMQAVVAAATLVNYLPLRPGLFARAAYHRQFNGISVVQTFRVVLEGIAVSGGITAYFVLVAVSMGRLSGSAVVGTAWAVAAPVPVLAALIAVPRTRVWAAAILVRYTELLLCALRLTIAFALVGVELSPAAALACAAAVVVTTLVPFVSNGLGLTEWTIGLLAPTLAGVDLGVGMTAQLISRAAEMVAIACLGTPAFLWTVHRMRRAARA